MNIKENSLYGLTSVQELFNVLKTDEQQYKNAVIQGYKIHTIEDKKGKRRKIYEPNDTLINIQRNIKSFLQLTDCPDYNQCGYQGQSALKNARMHIGKHAIVTTDISNYYPSTKEKYIREFFEKELNVSGKVSDILVQLTTYEGFLPAGAPTSTILAFLSHKKLFDKIDAEMKKQGILFTLYADDITLSANHGITRYTVKYIQSLLNKHNLRLKADKTKFFSYKKALVTGYYLHQSGKITVPYWIGNTIKEKLKKTPLLQMDLYQVKSLLGYINYQRQIDKNSFNVLRIRAIKRLKKLMQS